MMTKRPNAQNVTPDCESMLYNREAAQADFTLFENKLQRFFLSRLADPVDWDYAADRPGKSQAIKRLNELINESLRKGKDAAFIEPAGNTDPSTRD